MKQHDHIICQFLKDYFLGINHQAVIEPREVDWSLLMAVISIIDLINEDENEGVIMEKDRCFIYVTGATGFWTYGESRFDAAIKTVVKWINHYYKNKNDA